MTTLEKIRQKCIEANPEIAKRITPEMGPRGGVTYRTYNAPIRLADVLLAMQGLADDDDKRHWCVQRFGEFVLDARHSDIETLKTYPGVVVGAKWNLRNDDLEQQSEECVEFIGRILSV